MVRINRFRTLFKKAAFIISVLLAAIIASCSSPEFNGDILDAMEEDTSSTVYFKKDASSPVAFSLKFQIGNNYTSANLPGNDSSSVASLRPGFCITGWKPLDAEHYESGTFTLDASGYIRSFHMPVKTITLYGDGYYASSNTPYTVVYKIQNTAMTGYEVHSSAQFHGTTSTAEAQSFTDAAAHVISIPGFTPLISSITEAEIAADGSTVVEILYDRNQYTLTLHKNDGSTPETTITQDFYYGVPAALTAPGFTLTGYNFIGWATSTSRASYETVDYTDGADYTIGAADADLYAVWADSSICNVYIASYGDDTNGEGTSANPYKTFTKAYTAFTNPTALRPDGSFKNTIHILTDYDSTSTGATSFVNPQGTSEEIYVNIVGAKGGVDGTNVHLNIFVSKDYSFIYITNGQRFKISNVDFTSGRDLTAANDYCGYGCFYVTVGTELTLENCSIKNYYAKDCVIIVSGVCHLNNVEITDNVAVCENPSSPWGCAVNVAEGYLHIKGSVKIKRNKTLDTAKNDLNCPYNVWIGKYDATLSYDHPIMIDGPITGSEIGVICRENGLSEFTCYYTIRGGAGSTPPSTYFTSDAGLGVVLNAFGEAELIPVTDIYVSSTGTASGNGTSAAPFATLQAAIDRIAEVNVASNQYTIHVSGTVNGVTSVQSTINSKAAKITIEGTAAASSILDGGDAGAVIQLDSLNIPVDIKKLTIQNGSADRGGGIKISGSSTATLVPVLIENCVIDSNTATSSGGGISNANTKVTVTVKNTTISGNTSGSNGGGIANSSGYLVIGENVNIQGNTAAYDGGGIYCWVSNVAGLVMSEGSGRVISGNTANSNGGGISISSGNDNTITIVNTEISGNGANNGAGIDISAKVFLNLGNGVVIKGNTATVNGGGIYSKGNIYMYGTAMIGEPGSGAAASGTGAHSNMAVKGGAVYLTPNESMGTTGLYLGKMMGTSTVSESELTGGIYWNYASGDGGAVYVEGRGGSVALPVEILTGNIVRNTAAGSGGGIYNLNRSALYLYGGVLSGNSADTHGGAVASVYTSGAVPLTRVKSAVSIPAGSSSGNDIYLGNNCKITIDQNLVATAFAVIEPQTYAGTTAVLAAGDAAISGNNTKFTVKDDSTGGQWEVNSTGYLQERTATPESTPLTLEAVSSAATVSFQNKASGPVTYKVNGGAAVEIASGNTGTITLAAAGDKVEFYGNNAAYGADVSDNSSKISCTADCYVYGNIMSLINSSSYEDLTELTQTYTFAYLFYNNSKIKNKTGAILLLPATTLANYCYNQMFSGCTGLTSAPELPATALSANCYNSMFYGCTGLIAAPELPATTLAAGCYGYMFNGCTGLTSAPELPATTLAANCYEGMFQGCTGLTSAPELPATTLAAYCYYCMFDGCTGLTSAPELPATTLASSCYSFMFYTCTGLTSAPALPATTLTDYCYRSMFEGCTGLTSAPELPATTLLNSCYYQMFFGCTSLHSVTCLATNISASECVTNWLSGVASTGTFTKAPAMTGWTLNSANGIPAGWTVQDKPIPLTLEAVSSAATVSFLNKASGPVTYKVNGGSAVEIASGTTGTIELAAAGDKVEFFGNNETYGISSSNSSNISCTADCYVYGNIMSLINSSSYEDLTELTQTYTFAYLFNGNSKIKNKTGANLLLPATTLAANCYRSMIRGCTGLTAAPELPATILAAACYEYMFYGCTGLTAAPDLPATTLANNCYEEMFNGCTGLTAAPELPATTLANYCYRSMFNGCTGLTAAPELPATTLAADCYDCMFNGCTGLTAAPELPATTLANYCYYQMFCGCTGLTAAPALPATTLADYCYTYMFQGCTNLNSVTCLATNISALNCVNNWLSGVASTGTFYKAAGIGVETSDGWTRGSSGIPSTWTVDSYLGNKVPGASLEPGDIVFNDGSAVAYSDTLTLTPEQEAAAIAVIFYKGNGLNKSGDTSIRTLGVGLIQKTNIGWAANGAAAIGQDITAIQGNLTSGDKYGKDNLSAISAFLTAAEGVNDDTTTLSNYPVFNFAANYKTEKLGSETSSRLTGTAFENGWYIPTIQELNQAYLIKNTLNAALDLCGGAQMTASYWSSNQNSGYKSNANNLTFANGNMTANGTGMVNGYQMSTRVIREF